MTHLQISMMVLALIGAVLMILNYRQMMVVTQYQIVEIIFVMCFQIHTHVVVKNFYLMVN